MVKCTFLEREVTLYAKWLYLMSFEWLCKIAPQRIRKTCQIKEDSLEFKFISLWVIWLFRRTGNKWFCLYILLLVQFMYSPIKLTDHCEFEFKGNHLNSLKWVSNSLSCEFSVLFSLDVGNCPAKLLFSYLINAICLLRLPSEDYNFEKTFL